MSFDQYRIWKKGSGILILHPELLSSHPESRIQVFFRTTYRAIVKSRIPSRNFVFSQDPCFNCVKSRTENTLLHHVDMEQLQPEKLAESKRDFALSFLAPVVQKLHSEVTIQLISIRETNCRVPLRRMAGHLRIIMSSRGGYSSLKAPQKRHNKREKRQRLIDWIALWHQLSHKCLCFCC